MHGYKSWALPTLAGALALTIAALATWLLLEWLTGGSRPRAEVALVVGAALGAALAAAATAAARRWSDEDAARRRRALLARQVDSIAAAARRLDTNAHSESVSDEEAARLSPMLARDCETLRDAPVVLDHLMLGRMDEPFEVVAGLLKTRRSLEALNQPKGKEGLSRLEQYCRAFAEVGEDSLAFQISLRGVSNDLDDLRLQLANLLESLRCDSRPGDGPDGGPIPRPAKR